MESSDERDECGAARDPARPCAAVGGVLRRHPPAARRSSPRLRNLLPMPKPRSDSARRAIASTSDWAPREDLSAEHVTWFFRARGTMVIVDC